MAHNITSEDSMAWVQQKPWHGLGKEVRGDLSAHEMMVEAGVQWTVSKAPLFTTIGGVVVDVSKKAALVRDDIGTVLDVVGTDWNPLQNEQAFDFFKEFVDAGELTMETAGSLCGGRYVWALARANEAFTVSGNDNVKSYFLLTNTHQYGKVIDIRQTTVRVVCNNTLNLALKGTDGAYRVSHRTAFNEKEAKEQLGIARKNMEDLKEAAQFLASKTYVEEDVLAYFDTLFPIVTKNKEEKKQSRNAKKAVEALTHAPGFDMSPGTWWTALNSVTFVADQTGRTDEARFEKAMYGTTRTLKQMALNLALEAAKKS